MPVHELKLPETILSVAGLATYIQDLLAEDPQLRQVWVTGEVVSCNPHRSGLFFTLQDPQEKAGITCVVWNSQVERLTALPQPGEQVVVLGQVRVFSQQGRYQLAVWQVYPAGAGVRSLRLQQVRDRLMAEGLFDPFRKRSLPVHPSVVAVVTSPQAAAWGDICRTLQQRYPGLSVLLSPAQVQGEAAPLAIVRAIERVVQDGRAQVLILSRGGGASEDLACFNDEQVVRAIAECPIPIVTGIGHQRDESLADLAADVCAHTPTAAAEQAVPNLADLHMAHADRVVRLAALIHQVIANEHHRLAILRRQVLQVQPDRQLRQEQQRLRWLKHQLAQALTNRLRSAQAHQARLTETLQALDPQAVLQRGYAIVRSEQASEQAIVRSTRNLTLGQTIEIQLASDRLKATVTELPTHDAHAQT